MDVSVREDELQKQIEKVGEVHGDHGLFHSPAMLVPIHLQLISTLTAATLLERTEAPRAPRARRAPGLADFIRNSNTSVVPVDGGRPCMAAWSLHGNGKIWKAMKKTVLPSFASLSSLVLCHACLFIMCSPMIIESR